MWFFCILEYCFGGDSLARKKTGIEIIVKNDAGDNIISGSTEGKEVQHSKDFGCGIDVHSRMIQVSVLVRQNMSVFEYRSQFDTTKESILAAKEWVISTIKDHSIPYVDPTVMFHYCLESIPFYRSQIMGWSSKHYQSFFGTCRKEKDGCD